MEKTQTTFMVAMTKRGRDPIWRTDDGPPFILEADGETIRKVPWWRWWRGYGPGIRRLPPPHLTYTQVAAAHHKSTLLLKALREGPVILNKGIMKAANGKVIMTKAIAGTVIHWMESCGMVFHKTPMKGGRVKIDLDVERTRKNKFK